MTPSASIERSELGARRGERSVLWASVIAALFAAVAAISFAIDQTVTLSSLPAFPPPQTAGE